MTYTEVRRDSVFLSLRGQMMVFKEAEEVWDYYKSTRTSPKVWAHWSVRVTFIGFLVSGFLGLIGLRTISVEILFVELCHAFFFLYLWGSAMDHALAEEYSLECAIYRLDSSRDKRYLRYMLFLNKLADQQYTREDIVKLRQAVEIAEIPTPPGIQFNDHPLFWLLFVVPFVGGLWTLFADLIKQADFWKRKQEAIATLSAFGVKILLSGERSQDAKSMLVQLDILGWGLKLIFLLIACYYFWRGFLWLWGHKTQYQQLQRFLQWAEHDIEEARALRAAQRLHRLHTRTVQI